MNPQAFDEPFRHWVFEGCLTVTAGHAYADAKASLDEHLKLGLVDYRYGTNALWKGYHNELERKIVCTTPYDIGEMSGLFTWLRHTNGCEILKNAGIECQDLRIDSSWHGGGIHAMQAGHKLAPHVDYALHPKFDPPMERRYSFVLFLNPRWDKRWGGALEFWNDSVTDVVHRVYPVKGRAVLFENCDVGYHGVEEIAENCPEVRMTASAFWISPARVESKRKRALFVPQRR